MSDTPALPPRYSTYMLGNLNKSDDGPLMLVEDILALNVAWSKVLDERDAKFQRDLAAAQADLKTARTEVECLSDSCKAALKNYDEARAEAAALRVDAERWRNCRTLDANSVIRMVIDEGRLFTATDRDAYIDKQRPDAAIDQARKESGNG